MADYLDDHDRIIEQEEDDFNEEALGIRAGTTFRRPTGPVTLVLDSRDRSVTLDLDSKKKEVLFLKQRLDAEIGKCGNSHIPNFSNLVLHQKRTRPYFRQNFGLDLLQ